MRWVFVNGALGRPTRYEAWPTVVALFREVYKGVQPGRGGALVAIDRKPLLDQMRMYFDPGRTNKDVRERYPDLMHDEARYDADEMRAMLLKRSQFRSENVIAIDWLPFDTRWLYWEREGKLLNEKRREFAAKVRGDNLFLICTQKPRKGPVSPALVSSRLGSYYVFDPYTTYFPLHVYHNDLHGNGFESGIRPECLEAWCRAAGMEPFESGTAAWTNAALKAGDDLFYHILAVLWSPAYRQENDAALRQDWPRVPIPADAAVLDVSAELGRIVGDLLLPDKPAPGVTTGRLRPELRTLAVPSKVGGGPIDPNADLKVEAGWGFRGQKNAVMCGKGKVRPCPSDSQGALDVFLNDRVYWSNVPANVWTMTIGGYPVLKKWLSYREFKVLGRTLRLEEMTYFTEVIRRLKALLMMGDALDANYRAAAARTVDLGTSHSAGGETI